MKETFVYCHNVASLLQAMGCIYDSSERRLFIDISKPSLKCVLLHHGIDMLQYQSATPFILRKHENMNMLLMKIKYSEHKMDGMWTLEMLLVVYQTPMLFGFMGQQS